MRLLTVRLIVLSVCCFFLIPVSQGNSLAATITGIDSISAGNNSNCVVLSNATVKCWGSNQYGQLGDGTTRKRTSAVMVSGVDNAAQVSVGGMRTCVLLKSESVKCWADGFNRKLREPGLANVLQVSAGSGYVCAVLHGGSVKCKGDNDSGQLGTGNTQRSLQYQPVPGLPAASQVSTSISHSCAVLLTGKIYCWGGNWDGQLGDGSESNRHSPTEVLGVSDAAEVATGGTFTCARLSDGKVRCWGDNSWGQIGDGTNASNNDATQVLGITDAIQIASSSNGTACALTLEHKVKCWGRNSYGQIGDGTTEPRNIPTEVVGISNARMLAMSVDHTCALLMDGSVKCWGRNDSGQLGDGTLVDSHVPVALRDDVLNPPIVPPIIQTKSRDLTDSGNPGLVDISLDSNRVIAGSVVGIEIVIRDDKNSMYLTGELDFIAPPGTGTYYKSQGYSPWVSRPTLQSRIVEQNYVQEVWRGAIKVPTVPGTWICNRVDIKDVVGNLNQVVNNRLGIGNAANGGSGANLYVGTDVPGAPQNVAARSWDGALKVSLSPPDDTGGLPITSYQYSLDGNDEWQNLDPNLGDGYATIDGLANGRSYSLTLRAVNSAGAGESSFPVFGRPSSTPAIPIGLDLNSRTASSVGLNWSLPDNGGSTITGYQVRYSINGGSTWSNAVSTGSISTSYTVSGLTTGASYVFQIAAINSVGTSDWSLSTSPVLLAGIPNQVATPTVTGQTETSVSLSWTAPTANGDAITNYIVEFSTDSGVSWTTFSHQASSSTSITVTGLSRGIAHLFRVRAVNGQGAGSTSASTSATPQVKPAAPAGISITIPTLTSLTLSWSAPDNGGSTITGYQVRYSSNGGSTWSNPVNTGSIRTSYTVSGLSTGASYVFQIAAINSVGTSDWSNQSTSAITLSKKSQTITFTAPASVLLGKPDVTLTVKTSAVGLTTKLTVAPASAKYCSIVGTKVHAKAVGTCTVVATQVGNAAYLPATPVIRTIAIKKK